MAARTFYIEVNTPKSAVRGEQIGVQVAAFNFYNQPIEVVIK